MGMMGGKVYALIADKRSGIAGGIALGQCLEEG